MTNVEISIPILVNECMIEKTKELYEKGMYNKGEYEKRMAELYKHLDAAIKNQSEKETVCEKEEKIAPELVNVAIDEFSLICESQDTNPPRPLKKLKKKTPSMKEKTITRFKKSSECIRTTRNSQKSAPKPKRPAEKNDINDRPFKRRVFDEETIPPTSPPPVLSTLIPMVSVEPFLVDLPTAIPMEPIPEITSHSLHMDMMEPVPKDPPDPIFTVPMDPATNITIPQTLEVLSRIGKKCSHINCRNWINEKRAKKKIGSKSEELELIRELTETQENEFYYRISRHRAQLFAMNAYKTDYLFPPTWYEKVLGPYASHDAMVECDRIYDGIKNQSAVILHGVKYEFSHVIRGRIAIKDRESKRIDLCDFKNRRISTIEFACHNNSDPVIKLWAQSTANPKKHVTFMFTQTYSLGVNELGDLVVCNLRQNTSISNHLQEIRVNVNNEVENILLNYTKSVLDETDYNFVYDEFASNLARMRE